MPTAEEIKYHQGIVDGVTFALAFDVKKRDATMRELAAMRHVCYCSIMGPYCVICHRDMNPPYEPVWSK